jgi:hypothetical protein
MARHTVIGGHVGRRIGLPFCGDLNKLVLAQFRAHFSSQSKFFFRRARQRLVVSLEKHANERSGSLWSLLLAFLAPVPRQLIEVSPRLDMRANLSTGSGRLLSFALARASIQGYGRRWRRRR